MKLLPALLTGLIVLLASPLRACTTFCLVNDREILFGRNFDYYCADGRVMVNRRGLQKTAFWTNSGLRWVSRFGSISTNQFGHEFPNGGINEAGLVIEHMLLDESSYPIDARPALTELQWVQYQLDCSATVEEVLASDARVRIDAGSTPLHFLVADRSGRCAVIEFLGGRRIVHVDESLPVAALTNHTYESSLTYASTTSPALASHTSSLGRFVHAAESVRAFSQAGGADPIGYAFAALANVNQPNWTRWSIVYDIGNLSVHFRTLPSSAIKQIRLDAVDFSPNAAIRQMDINTPLGGLVVPQTAYSGADNLAVLLSVYRQTPPLSWVSTSYLQTRAAYPASIVAAAMPVVTTQPQGRTAAVGEAVELSVGVSPGATVQWFRNGRVLSGATSNVLRIPALEPASAGVYTARIANAIGSAVSEPAVVGLLINEKVRGTAYEFGGNMRHAGSGNTYDQFLLTGTAASITADPGQVSRMSFIDLQDDIVQVEFSGPGTLSLLVDGATGPAAPVKYNQDVPYVRGHATIVLAGATADTHVCIFSVGAMTNPAVVRSGETYDAHADVAVLAVQSVDGRLGAIRCGNTAFSAAAGATGVLAPGVSVGPGPVNLHDISAADTAAAFLVLGSAPTVRIAGGDLYQINGGAVRATGLAARSVLLAEGTSSANVLEPARALRGRILRDGRDASSELIAR